MGSRQQNSLAGDESDQQLPQWPDRRLVRWFGIRVEVKIRHRVPGHPCQKQEGRRPGRMTAYCSSFRRQSRLHAVNISFQILRYLKSMCALFSYLELPWFAAGKYAERLVSCGEILCAMRGSDEHASKKILRVIFALKNSCWHFESSLFRYQDRGVICNCLYWEQLIPAVMLNWRTLLSSQISPCIHENGGGKHSCWGISSLVPPKRAAARRIAVWPVPLSAQKGMTDSKLYCQLKAVTVSNSPEILPEVGMLFNQVSLRLVRRIMAHSTAKEHAYCSLRYSIALLEQWQ